jgi:hypothetical protein
MVGQGLGAVLGEDNNKIRETGKNIQIWRQIMDGRHRIIILISSAALLIIGTVVFLICIDNQYITYHPEAQDLYKLEFEYPSNWEWNRANQPIAQYDDCLSTADPTKSDYGLNEEPNFEQGLIMVWVLQIDPISFTASTFIDELLARIHQNLYLDLRTDDMIDVDGYSARRIVYRIAPRPGPMNQVPLLEEYIFVTVGDRYYEFSLSIPESERLDPYGLAFDHLIESVHFLP